MDFNKQYEVLFESEKQKSTPIFKDGTLWDEMVFAILTDTSELFGQSNPTTKNTDLTKIQFQIHQAKELAPIMLNHYDDNTKMPGLKSLDLNEIFFTCLQFK